jgi:hypothetical protein
VEYSVNIRRVGQRQSICLVTVTLIISNGWLDIDMRSNNYRDANLLKLAAGERCLLESTPRCQGTLGQTTVPCHSNLMEDGKAKALKASDARTVWGCYSCHQWLDQGMATKEKKKRLWDAAHHRQIEEWIKIADNICLKPWKVEAARKVLDHLGVPYGQS